MPLKVVELFGHVAESPGFHEAVRSMHCPFIGGPCRKRFSDGMISGLCTAAAVQDSRPVICCPQRLYSDDHRVLKRVSHVAFGKNVPVLTEMFPVIPEGGAVIPFGQRLGKELKVRARDTSYSFDWILARVHEDGSLEEFVAVEVQTIDTTGSYRRQSWELQKAHNGPGISGFDPPKTGKSSNFNWENVSKRILPQLITKGHLLRLEERCRKGLFFICPTPVLERIYRRLGNSLAEYSPQPGAITFHDYGLESPDETCAGPLDLVFGSSFTTTHDQIATAFAAPQHLPPKDSYSEILRSALRERLRSR